MRRVEAAFAAWAVVITASLVFASAPVGAQTSWDQQRAAAAAAELASALDGLRDALRHEPPSGMRGSGSAMAYRVRDRLRLMESEARYLASQLEEGRGRDETLPIFERIDEIRLAAVEDANRMFLTQPVLEKVEAARPPLEKLAGYYGVTLDRQLQTR